MISYSVQIKDSLHCFDETVKVYRAAVRYLIDITFIHYDEIKDLPPNKAQRYMEILVHSTAGCPARYPKFDRLFYKFPSYLRRSAITTVIGKVSSYLSMVKNWEKDGRKGKRPHMNFNQNMMPCFYQDNMFVEKDGVFKIKVYHKRDWIWMPIVLRKTDLDYIRKNCSGLKEHAPVLKKRHGGYSLCFGYDHKSEKRFIKDKDVSTVIGVDLGLNSDAVCSVVRRDGIVTGYAFIDHPVEKDRFYTLLHKIRKCQSQGSRHMNRLWVYADNYNTAIVTDTARRIVEYAVAQNAQVIVFENLTGIKPKKGASKAQKMTLWRKRDIQHRVEEMAARSGIRTSYICAWNTSQLAFDGSGKVKRGKDCGYHTNAVCEFQNGKIYNADLSASKNIAARYFTRVITKTLSASERLSCSAKVPELGTRTKHTLSTLISLAAVRTASCCTN